MSTRRRGVAVLAACLLCLLVAGLATMRSAGDVSFVTRWSAPENTRQPAREAYSEPAFATGEVTTAPARDTDPTLASHLGLALLVLGGLAVLLIIAVIVHRVIALRRDGMREEATEILDVETLSAEQARDALDEAAVQLRRGGRPADAVIAAWIALQTAIGRAGIRRAPTQTTEEFVVAVLADLDLPRASLQSFAELYGQALFSDIPVGDAERDRAADLLEELSSALPRPAGSER